MIRRCCPVLVVLLLVSMAACGGGESDSASTNNPGPNSTMTGEPSESVPGIFDTEAFCESGSVTFEAGADGPHGVTVVLPDDDEALAAQIAASFCSPEWTFVDPDGSERTVTARTVLSGDDAACVGSRLVDVLGVARAKELWFGAGPWHLLGFGLSNDFGELQIERAEAESIVGVFVECSDQWKLLLILSVTDGADTISDRSAECVADTLSDDAARLMLIGEIDRAYDDPSQPDAQPFPQLLEPLLAAYDECLSAAELGHLDFD